VHGSPRPPRPAACLRQRNSNGLRRLSRCKRLGGGASFFCGGWPGGAGLAHTYVMTVWSMLEECVGQLDEPFRRSEIIGWFRRHHPDVNGATLGAHIQAATVNAANSAGRARRTTRWAHGLRCCAAADLLERRSWSSAGERPLVTVVVPWSPWRMARMWHAPGCPGCAYASGRDARAAGVFLARLAVRGRDAETSVGVVPASALAA
jgi:hypothetical protein